MKRKFKPVLSIIKKVFIAILLFQFMLLGNSCSNNTEKKSAPSIIIKNVNVIDAVNGLRTNQTVIISGNKIAEVGKISKIKDSSDATIIDAKGKYLIPGLWDAHVHLVFNRDIEPVMFPLFIANGITSIRDTGGHLDLLKPLIKKAQQNEGTTPRVFVAGPLIDGIPIVYDGSGGMPNLAIGAGTIEYVIHIVDSLADAGVNQIKAYEMLSPEVYRELVIRATKRGLLVTGHVPLSMDVVEASDLGLRGMEHMRNLEMSCSSDFDSLLSARKQMILVGKKLSGSRLRSSMHSAQRQYAIRTQDTERRNYVLKTLAKNDTWQTPTLTIVASGANRVYARESWRDYYRYLPEPVRSQWTNNGLRNSKGSASESSVAFASWAYDMVKAISDAGINIMAGTDSPIAYLTPGYSLHEELRLLVGSGLTTMQAIEAATIRPAQFFGIDNELGTIEKGMLADLVLLDANPLENINNTRTIRAVIKNGNLLDRDALDGILEKLCRE
ncbi:amidohydrolase family protein [Bacteroidota bacterium]